MKQSAVNATKYFNSNRDRIAHVMNLLYDDKSREILQGMILFRMTRDRKYHLGSDPNQYFPEDVIKLRSDEVFIDCGGYIGDTVLDFIKRSNNTFKRIVTFEPDPGLKEKIENNISSYKNIVFINKGVYNKTAVLKFTADGSSGGSIIESDSTLSGNFVEIETVAIDDIPECRDATFIKMDLEGGEWNALEGSIQTILRNHPKLAICIYHSDEDMLRLIEYIHELVPEYKLYVRQHSKIGTEIVAYAIP